MKECAKLFVFGKRSFLWCPLMGPIDQHRASLYMPVVWVPERCNAKSWDPVGLRVVGDSHGGLPSEVRAP